MLEQGHFDLGFPKTGILSNPEEDYPEDCVIDPETGFAEEQTHVDESVLTPFSREEIDRIKDVVRIMKSYGIEI